MYMYNVHVRVRISAAVLHLAKDSSQFMSHLSTIEYMNMHLHVRVYKYMHNSINSVLLMYMYVCSSQ